MCFDCGSLKYSFVLVCEIKTTKIYLCGKCYIENMTGNIYTYECLICRNKHRKPFTIFDINKITKMSAKNDFFNGN